MTGTPCDNCPGHLVVYETRRSTEFVTRRWKCWLCSWKPKNNKIVTRESSVRVYPELRKSRQSELEQVT